MSTTINDNLFNYTNTLINHHFAASWRDPILGFPKLQDLSFLFLVAKCAVDAETIDGIGKAYLKGSTEIISLKARNFTEWLSVRKLGDQKTAAIILKRLQLPKRRLLEGGTNEELLLRRLFEKTINAASPDEKASIIEQKRKLSPVDQITNTSISMIERIQIIVSKVMNSEHGYIGSAFVMVAVSLVALHALGVSSANLLNLFKAYVNAINSMFFGISKALDCIPSRRYHCLAISVLTYLSKHVYGPNQTLSEWRDIIWITTGFLWGLSEIATLANFPLSGILSILMYIVPNSGAIRLALYLAPIVLPFSVYYHTARETNPIASNFLQISAEELAAWRIKKEIKEACDIWIHEILKSDK